MSIFRDNLQGVNYSIGRQNFYKLREKNNINVFTKIPLLRNTILKGDVTNALPTYSSYRIYNFMQKFRHYTIYLRVPSAVIGDLVLLCLFEDNNVVN